MSYNYPFYTPQAQPVHLPPGGQYYYGPPMHSPAYPGWPMQPPDHATGVAVPFRSSKYPWLHPNLAADSSLQLRWDLKKKPQAAILDQHYKASHGSPATACEAARLHVRLISKMFPWSIDIHSPVQVTLADVWHALYAALQEYIVDSEWALISDNKSKRESIEKAAAKRPEDRKLKRIDWLGEHTLFKGLERDESFEKTRIMPGTAPCVETWLVKLGTPS